MERIREAVEQARRERKTASAKADSEEKARKRREFVPVPDVPADAESSPRPSIQPRTNIPQHKARAAREDAQEKGPDIEYTKTRQVEVSPATREKNRLVAAIPNHPLMDTYSMLRTRVLREMKANSWRTIAVTSPATGSGKTLTAINLAISIGRDLSHTALLIDGDLRQPSISEYFGYKPEYGLNDYFYNDVPLQDILFHPDMDRLTVLPGRKPIPESAEALASGKITKLMGEAKSRYENRIVVVDVAPVLSVDDALALIPNIDCMLMVAESGGTRREDLSQALELLQGIPILGTVLNKVDKKVAEAY
jgi:capsular exopolysaccharide synthesis family protein